MMRRGTKFTAGLAAGALAASLLAPSLASGATERDNGRGQTACAATQRGRTLRTIVLTADGALACADTHRPGRAAPIGPVTGLSGDTALVGIDFRPATGAGSTRSTPPPARRRIGSSCPRPCRARRSAWTSTRPSTASAW